MKLSEMHFETGREIREDSPVAQNVQRFSQSMQTLEFSVFCSNTQEGGLPIVILGYFTS